MVRLKGTIAAERIDVESCFNSTMVRLKVMPMPCMRPTIICFNSTMVRLKVSLLRLQHRVYLVSIPLWFD